MPRRYTAELLAARADGRTIVCSLDPYQNVPVTYDPRHPHDPSPWSAPGIPYRMTGRECHAIDADGAWVRTA